MQYVSHNGQCTLYANAIVRHGMITANADSVPNIIAAVYVPKIIGMKDANAGSVPANIPPPMSCFIEGTILTV